MALIHAAAAAAGMIKLTCPRCGEIQSKLRSKSGRYVCKRCHHAFDGGRARVTAPKRLGRR